MDRDTKLIFEVYETLTPLGQTITSEKPASRMICAWCQSEFPGKISEQDRQNGTHGICKRHRLKQFMTDSALHMPNMTPEKIKAGLAKIKTAPEESFAPDLSKI